MNLQELMETLIGIWEGPFGKGLYHEEWHKTSNNELSGKGYIIKENQNSNAEILKLIQNEKGVFYIADVSHNPGPVSFRLSDLSDNIAVFENPEHDFPQKITYSFSDFDSLTAVIESLNEADTRKFIYDLKRIKS